MDAEAVPPLPTTEEERSILEEAKDTLPELTGRGTIIGTSVSAKTVIIVCGEVPITVPEAITKPAATAAAEDEDAVAVGGTRHCVGPRGD